MGPVGGCPKTQYSAENALRCENRRWIAGQLAAKKCRGNVLFVPTRPSQPFPRCPRPSGACSSRDSFSTGQRDPIEVVDQLVVAGWDLYEACITEGVEPVLTEIEPPADIVSYVLRRNVPRNFTPMDRACIAVLAREQFQTLASKRKGRREKRDETSRSWASGRWWQHAARLVGASPNSVRKLASYREHHPDIFEAVRSRRIGRLRDCVDLLRLDDPADREEAIRRYGPSRLPPLPKIVSQILAEKRASQESPATAAGRWVVHERDLIHIDDRLVADDAVDTLYADIVYDDVAMAEAVALLAVRALRPGGMLAMIPGQRAVPEIITILSRHLRYVAVGAYVQSHQGQGGQPSGRGRATIRRTSSMPVLLFAKEGETPHEIADNTWVAQRTEELVHPWQKCVSATADLLAAITPERGLVLDPCCGSGTTGVAALGLGMRFVGADSDAGAVAIARARLAEAEAGIE